MESEGLIDRETALVRIDPAQLEQLERPRIDTKSEAGRHRHRCGRLAGRRPG
jgi:hypothetical protein